MHSIIAPTRNLCGIFQSPEKPPGASGKSEGGMLPDLEEKGGITRAAAHSERVGRADLEYDARHQILMQDVIDCGQAPNELTCPRRSSDLARSGIVWPPGTKQRPLRIRSGTAALPRSNSVDTKPQMGRISHGKWLGRTPYQFRGF